MSCRAVEPNDVPSADGTDGRSWGSWGVRRRRERDRLPTWVGPLVSALSFWGAIALPVCYLTLLAVGIDDTQGLVIFLGLFGLHVLTLVAGRSYRPESSR